MIRLRRGIAILCVLPLSVTLPVAPGAAGAGQPAGTPRMSASAQEVVVTAAPGGAELRVRGRTVARLTGRKAEARLRAAARVLEPLLVPPTTVTTEITRKAARLLVDDQVILTATAPDARRLGQTLARVVGQWARALEDALTVAPITLSKTDVVLSPGFADNVSVSTAGAAPVQLGGFDARVVAVQLDAGRATLIGRAVGTTVVPFKIGPYGARLAVSVKPPAGDVPRETSVVVTGLPATPELIREAVERRLQEVVRTEPGAFMSLGTVPIENPLSPGDAVSLPVEVSIRSPFAGPVAAAVNVRVANEPVDLGDPDVLLISNRPEKIKDSGWLFNEVLQPRRPTRLLYHHLNGTPGQVRVLKITLTNSGPARARIHYLSGLAGPSPDPLFIGFASTVRFIEALLGRRGYIVEVPASGATTFTAYTLTPLALVSGLMQFQVVEGGPVELLVHVRVPYLLDRTVTTDLGPGAFPHPRGTFPGSLVEFTREVPVTQPVALADLGVMSGLRDPKTGEPLVGDYGVLYRIRVRVVNPTGREASTVLVANAAGGIARGLFIIDGKTVDVGLMQPTEDREVAVFAVPAGATRDIALVTMPVAGSFYPVRLGLRPR